MPPDMQSVLIGSEYPVMDTLLFYFPQSSYRKAFRGVAECYAFSRFYDHDRLKSLFLWSTFSFEGIEKFIIICYTKF